jgi:O-antigen/teichoic acid export membrane protein
MAALLVATAIYYMAYGYFRGRMRLGAANGLQVLASGVVPILLLLLVPGIGVDGLLALMGAVLASLSLVWIAGPLLRALRVGRARLAAAGRGLLDYGARRVPGEIAQVGLFALVPVVASHVTSLTEVGYLAAALQVVAMLSVALNPIGLVLLPSFAERHAQDPQGMHRQVAVLAALAAHLAIFAAIQLQVFAATGLEIWLGPQFADADALARVTLLSAGPFVFYLSLRSSLDAVAVRSYNTRSNIAGLATFAVIAAAGLQSDVIEPEFAVAWAFAGGVFVQGAMTFVFVQRRFAVPVGDYALLPTLALALVTGAIALAVRPAIESAGAPLLWLAVVEVVLAAAFFGGLAVAGVRWIRTLREGALRGDG